MIMGEWIRRDDEGTVSLPYADYSLDIVLVLHKGLCRGHTE